MASEHIPRTHLENWGWCVAVPWRNPFLGLSTQIDWIDPRRGRKWGGGAKNAIVRQNSIAKCQGPANFGQYERFPEPSPRPSYVYRLKSRDIRKGDDHLFGQKNMSVSKVKCLHCGADILPQTAAATGGYCRSGRCEADRRSISYAESRRAKTEKRIASGELTRCPFCGCLVRTSKLDAYTGTKCGKRTKPHPFNEIFP